MIPAELRSRKGWLLWRLEPNPKPGKKPLKVPCYADGTRRRGEQGSELDRARLATYETVSALLDADLAGRWTGLGFAMLPEWGLVGLDFDQCVVDGRVDSSIMGLVGATYSEFSPSGTGIHAFLSGSLPDRKSPGFEVFCAKGFLTFTGQETEASELAFSGVLDHVNGAVTDLYEARFGSDDGSIAVRAPAQTATVEQLAMVLANIPNTGKHELDYDQWFRMVAAIHRETGGSDIGLRLALEVSGRSPKFNEQDLLRRVWPSIKNRPNALVGIGTLKVLAGEAGWIEPIEDTFDVVPEDAPAVVAQTPSSSKKSKSPGVRVKAERGGIPEAQHLCTDQANANRLVNAYGRQVLVAAGRWHVWDGKRWIADDADVYRYACRLSLLVHGEAKAVRARGSTGDAAAIAKAEGIAKALEAWAVKSEMKGAIEAAVGLARKMLTVEVDTLDADPWLLNVANGTVDLRTGSLRGHCVDDMITRLVPVAYVPDARCEVWQRALAQICMGNEPLQAFLQRWAGYCLTGSVVEQCFVVHWGDGSNGKSTVLDLLAATMGDYAGVAAPGLMLAAKGERHPTEIASLMGKRMVTAHESGEGVVLREDFIKQATGGDRLSARFMREDFFDFAPTHKLQLLTNHKPAVKGQDQGIWRRVLLVPYEASFGDEAAVLGGRATHLIDHGLVERLRGELEGILAWRVRGAVEWATQGGLRAPAVVRAASDAYKLEQDRVGQFVAECCERGLEHREPMTEGLGGGLYPAYVEWCREGGIHALAKSRFQDDILRVVDGIVEKGKVPMGNGRRRDVRFIRGVRLMPD
jgi:P4 family phage/plasmid primase-like protien